MLLSVLFATRGIQNRKLFVCFLFYLFPYCVLNVLRVFAYSQNLIRDFASHICICYFVALLFSTPCYLISFLPNCVIAIKNTNTDIAIAHGKNGIRLKPFPNPVDVTACRERETIYPL